MNPTTLSTRWCRDGLEMTQVWRSDSWAVYRSPHAHPSFDVFRIRQRKAATVFGRTYADREGFPAASEWGTDAWTVVSWSRVMDILHEAGQSGIPGDVPPPSRPQDAHNALTSSLQPLLRVTTADN